MADILPLGVTATRPFKKYSSGGSDLSWFSFSNVKHYTNAFIVQDNRILLGYKKRGFGQGKYNGFGGKVEPGETSLQAAIRELEEESGVKADLEHAGSFLFYTEGTEFAFQIEIYRSDKYTGEITESDEMRPEWFSTAPSQGDLDPSRKYPAIPFSKMWETDHVWLPLLMLNKKFVGRADFTKTVDVYTPYKWWYGVSLEEGH